MMSPIVGNTVNTVRNYTIFAELMRGETLDADRVLLSFDVVPLLTKILVDLAIKVAKERLRTQE